MLALLICIAVEIVLKRTEYYSTLGISIAKERQSLVRLVFKITEAYDVAGILHRVQNAVCTAIRLYQTMITQILIYPKRIEGSGIESRQEHVHNNKDVYLTILHAKRHIFIIVRELVC